jgi:uncharacterized protein (TIGR03437 family)
MIRRFTPLFCQLALVCALNLWAQAPSFQLDQTTLSFQAVQQGVKPDSQSVTLTLVGQAQNLSFTASASAPWVQISPKTGTLPATIQVSVDPTGLTASVYSATISLTVAQAVRQVAVSLTITPPLPAALSLSAQNISFSAVQGAAAAASSITVANSGSGPVDFSVAAPSDARWLTLSLGSGNVTPSQPATIGVTADPGGMLAGVFKANVVISSQTTGQSITVPVTLSITASPKKMLLSQTGLTYTGTSGGGRPLPQTFGIINIGQQRLDWTVQASAPGGGPAPWLSVSPTSGSVVRPYLDVSLVTVQVNPGALAPGDYYGQIRVLADGADNSPQTVTVLLRVQPPGIPLPPEVRPTGLIFIGVPGVATPSQTFNISIPGTSPLTYNSSRLTLDGTSWFTHTPVSGTFIPDQPATMTVQPNLSTLAPGIYNGVITIQFSDGHVSTVKLLTVVAPSSAGGASKSGYRDAGSCKPKNLNLQFTNLVSSSVVTLGQPSPMEVQAVDDCGVAVTPDRGSVSVTAAFSNGDPGTRMVHTTGGKWGTTWQPRSTASPVKVLITAFVFENGSLLANQTQLTVGIRTGSTTPFVDQRGVVNAASLTSNSLVAPGSLVTLFGQQLADPNSSGSSPGTSIGNTEVRLNDVPLTLLYASDGQINAQLPYDIPVNTELQLIVRHGGAQSVPLPVTVAAAQPAIFTADQTGTGQGVIQDYVTGTQNGPTSPAHAGDVVVIFCTGLGTAADSDPDDSGMIPLINPATVTIGGVPAAVQSGGLNPGSPGLYQLYVVVPDGVAPGDSVPVVVTSAGQNSPTVTMSVQDVPVTSTQ